MTNTNTIILGSVVRFDRPRARRRYVVCGIDQFDRLSIQAMSGSVRGSSSGGVPRDEFRLDDDQTVRFDGKLSRKFRAGAAFYLELNDHVGPKPGAYFGGELAEPIIAAWEARG